MRNSKVWAGWTVAIASLLLASCGGGGNSSTNVRLLNATATHLNLAMLANATIAIPLVPINTVSAYNSGIQSGSPTLQVNDADTGTALVTTSPSLGGGNHYVLVAYESGGAIKTAVIRKTTRSRPATPPCCGCSTPRPTLAPSTSM